MAVLVAWIIAGGGCAPFQTVPLDLTPTSVRVFVDGEPLAPVPAELELRADRDHTVFVKAEGFQPQLVVLRTTREGREDVLEPAAVQVRLEPAAGKGRDLQIESDEEAAPGA
ncbi:MAG: hypothetical protein MJE66_04075 [Proteobacteria bacterium]|nr:hypothetical protein [Pseudomonadota bacterium]